MDISLVAPDNFLAYERDEIIDCCRFVKDRITKRIELLNNLDQRQSDFESDMSDRSKYDAFITRLKTDESMRPDQLKLAETNKEALDKRLQENIHAIIELMNRLETQFAEDINSVSELQNQILNKLCHWRYEQQQIANGCTGTIKLDKLQLWCEEQADIIWFLRDQIKKAERIKQINQVFTKHRDQPPLDTLPELSKKITSLMGELLQGAFVVVDQPPQVIKQNTKFPHPVTVRHLAVHKLNSHMMSSSVTVRLLEESVVKTLKDPNCVITDRGGMAGPRPLEYNKESRVYFATFKNGQLKDFKRCEKKGVGLERVMEDKFALYFQTVLTIAEMKFKIWTISLPAVVISHGSQEAQAVATITWDNGFGEINREPFHVPSRVPWAQLSTVLSYKFASFTGKELSPENIVTLEKKLFRGAPSEFVTWTEFCKDNMMGNTFSFWHWCYEIIKLIEKYLKGPWCEGSIMGIIEREKAEHMLSTCHPGTFLARFSDSRLGAISISWIHSDGKVYSVNPLTKNDLSTKGFADTIMDLDKLQFLYPGTAKADAFGKHRKASITSTSIANPYVPLISDIDVPGNPNISTSPGSDYPNNPWSPYPHSPAARSSFSESDLLSRIMDVDSQASASCNSFEDQFPEFLIPLPPLPPNCSTVNGNVEPALRSNISNNSNMCGDDDNMDGNGLVMQQVLRVFQDTCIQNNPLMAMNNEQMIQFTQL